MKVSPRINWHARRAGGLFLGVRYSFPCTVVGEIIDDKGLQFTMRSLSFGLIFFTVTLDITTDIKPHE